MKGIQMINAPTIIATLALAAAVFFAIRYIVKEKKKGNPCIGCPYAGSCQKHSCGSSGSNDHSSPDQSSPQ